MFPRTILLNPQSNLRSADFGHANLPLFPHPNQTPLCLDVFSMSDTCPLNRPSVFFLLPNPPVLKTAPVLCRFYCLAIVANRHVALGPTYLGIKLNSI